MGKLSHCTLRERIVEEIRTKILNQELIPGMRIIEQDLAEEFGVSRGPIREALRQLEQEGMIEYKRNIGCSVRNATLDDIKEIYMLSSTYEILAVRSYDGQFSDEDIKRMDTILELMKELKDTNFKTIVSLDCLLHKVIVDKSGLPRLEKAWADMNYGNVLSCYVGKRDVEETAKRQYPIHKKLVDACKTRNTEVICDEISKHYMLTIDRVLKEGK